MLAKSGIKQKIFIIFQWIRDIHSVLLVWTGDNLTTTKFYPSISFPESLQNSFLFLWAETNVPLKQVGSDKSCTVAMHMI